MYHKIDKYFLLSLSVPLSLLESKRIITRYSLVQFVKQLIAEYYYNSRQRLTSVFFISTVIWWATYQSFFHQFSVNLLTVARVTSAQH